MIYNFIKRKISFTQILLTLILLIGLTFTTSALPTAKALPDSASSQSSTGSEKKADNQLKASGDGIIISELETTTPITSDQDITIKFKGTGFTDYTIKNYSLIFTRKQNPVFSTEKAYTLTSLNDLVTNLTDEQGEITITANGANLSATNKKLFLALYKAAYAVSFKIDYVKDGKDVFETSNPYPFDITPPSVTPKNFKDISKLGEERQEAINSIAKINITVGSACTKPLSGDCYSPTNVVNRGAMAEFMNSTVGKPQSAEPNKTISDNKDTDTNIGLNAGRRSAIKWLAAEEVTSGTRKGSYKYKKTTYKCTETSFCYKPWDSVNRGAMAEFLWNLAGKPTVTQDQINEGKSILTGNDYTISGNTNRTNAILWMAFNGITVGSTCKTNKICYAPNNIVTRGAMAEFLWKFYKKMHSPIDAPEPKPLPDSSGPDMLIVQPSDTTKFLNTSYLRSAIKTITFSNQAKPAQLTSGTSCTDVGANQSKQIYACSANSGEDIAIYQKDGVIANADSSYLFYGLTSLESINGFNATNFKYENIENMEGMFNLANISFLSKFPDGFGSKATTMYGMFGKTVLPADAPLFPEGFGSNAIDMREMFTNSDTGGSVILPENVVFPAGFGSKATCLGDMFYQATLPTTLTKFPAGFGNSVKDIANIDSRRAIGMYRMFSNAKIQSNIDWTDLYIPYTTLLQNLNTDYMFSSTIFGSSDEPQKYTISVPNDLYKSKFDSSATYKDQIVYTTLKFENTSNPTNFLGTTFVRADIKSITFKNEDPNDVDADENTCEDVSSDSSDKIQACSPKEGDDSGKVITIYQKDGVKANSDSSWLFWDMNLDSIEGFDNSNFITKYIYSMAYLFSGTDSNNTVTLPADLILPDGFGSNALKMNYMFFHAVLPVDFKLPAGFAKSTRDFTRMFEGTSLQSDINWTDLVAFSSDASGISLLTVTRMFEGTIFGPNNEYYVDVDNATIKSTFDVTVTPVENKDNIRVRSFLKKELQPSGSNFPTNFLYTTFERANIEALVFTSDTPPLPSDGVDCQDVSNDNSGRIQACSSDLGVHITVYQKDGVRANDDSSYLFSGMSKLSTLEIGNSDFVRLTSIINMKYMFLKTKLPDNFTFVADLGVNATDMNGTFFDTIFPANFTGFPEGFGSNATNMGGLFQFTNLPDNLTFPAGFGSKVINASNMFIKCKMPKNLTTFPAGFGSVADLTWGMFQGATLPIKFTGFPAGFGSKAKDMNNMFGSLDDGDAGVISVVIPSTFTFLPDGFGAEATTNMGSMFNNAIFPDSFTFPASFGSTTAPLKFMFSGAKLPTNPSFLPDGFGSRSTDLTGMFANLTMPSSFTTLPSGFGSANGVNLSSMFFGSTISQLTFPTDFGQRAAAMKNLFSNATLTADIDFTNCFPILDLLDVYEIFLNTKFGVDLEAKTYFVDVATKPIKAKFESGVRDGFKDQIRYIPPTIKLETSLPTPVKFLGTSLNRAAITSIEFKDADPDTAPAVDDSCESIASNNTNDILACKPADSMAITIYQDGGVRANPDSSGLFAGLSNLTSISGFNDANFITSNIKRASYMFLGTPIPANFTFPAGFGSNIVSMISMFGESSFPANFTFPAGFGSNATDTSNMFAYAQDLSYLTEFPAGFGKLSTNFYGMFQGCTLSSSFTKFPDEFGSKTTDMAFMFRNATLPASLTAFPAGFGKIATDMSDMFKNVTIPATFKAFPAGFGSEATGMNEMFSGATIQEGGLSTFPAGFGSNATGMNRMFVSAVFPADFTFPADFGSVADDMRFMFYGESSQTILPANLTKFPDGFGSKATKVSQMFRNVLFPIALEGFPAGFGSVSGNMGYMFYESVLPNTITEFPAGFGSAASDMERMFAGTTFPENLKEFPAGFGSGANNMISMFQGTTLKHDIDWSSLKQLRADVNVATMFNGTNFGPDINAKDYFIYVANDVIKTKFEATVRGGFKDQIKVQGYIDLAGDLENAGQGSGVNQYVAVCYENAAGSACTSTDVDNTGKAHYYYNWNQAVARVPAGYYLPSNTEYNDLISNLSANENTYKDLRTWAKFGWYESSSQKNWRANGSRWTSTSVNDSTAQNLYINNSDPISVNSCSKSWGLAVRYLSKPTLTIKGVSAQNKEYNGDASAAINVDNAGLEGVVSGHSDVRLVKDQAVGVFANKKVSNNRPVYTSGFSLEGADASYYRLIQPEVTANITPKSIPGSCVSGFDKIIKAYDPNIDYVSVRGTPTVNPSCLVQGDGVTVNYNHTGRFTDTSEGVDKDVVIKILGFGGTDGANYVVSIANNTTAAKGDISAEFIDLTGGDSQGTGDNQYIYMCYENAAGTACTSTDVDQTGNKKYYYNYNQAAARGIVQPGYYLPTKDQMQDLVDNHAGYTGTYKDYNTWLKSGDYIDSQLVHFNSYGAYWSSTPYPDPTVGNAWFLYINDPNTEIGHRSQSYGFTVRLFK